MEKEKYPLFGALGRRLRDSAVPAACLVLTEMVKTPIERMQVQAQTQPYHAAHGLAFPDVPLSLRNLARAWRGLGLNLAQSALTTYLYLHLFPSARQALRNAPLLAGLGDRAREALATAGAGLFAGLFISPLTYPLDLAKTLVLCSPQVERSQGFHGTAAAVGRIFSLYGARRLYHGFGLAAALSALRGVAVAAALASLPEDREPVLVMGIFLTAQALLYPLDTLLYPMDTRLRRLQIQTYSKYAQPETLRQINARHSLASGFAGVPLYWARSFVVWLPLSLLARDRARRQPSAAHK